MGATGVSRCGGVKEERTETVGTVPQWPHVEHGDNKAQVRQCWRRAVTKQQ